MDRNKNLLTGNNDRESTPSHERSRVSQNSPDLPTSPLDTPGQVSIYLFIYLSVYLSVYPYIYRSMLRTFPSGNFLRAKWQLPKCAISQAATSLAHHSEQQSDPIAVWGASEGITLPLGNWVTWEVVHRKRPLGNTHIYLSICILWVIESIYI